MITAIDSSVLIDVLIADQENSRASLEHLRGALRLGPVIACPVVWSEVRSAFNDSDSMQSLFSGANIQFDPFDEACAGRAGELWREYRKNGGTRDRIIGDFLIGAHAEQRGGRLLTRDRGFYRRYFRTLSIIGLIAE